MAWPAILRKDRLILSLLCSAAFLFVFFSPAKSMAQDQDHERRLDRLIDSTTKPPAPPAYATARGSVKDVSRQRITITRPDGRELTFKLVSGVRTEEGQAGDQHRPMRRKSIPLADIAVGDDVYVSFEKPARGVDARKAVGILLMK